jgi:hypothetical protein
LETISLARKYLLNQPITVEDEAEQLGYYREVPLETLSTWLNERRIDWFDMKQQFPGLRPDENRENHPQEYKMKMIETEIRLMETALREKAHLPDNQPSEPISKGIEEKAESIAKIVINRTIDELSESGVIPQGNAVRAKIRNPNRDEKVIINAINEGHKGLGFCHALDFGKVKPRKGWEDKSNPFPLPRSYVDAYSKGHTENRKHWQKRIQDYKSYVQRKFPQLIQRKKRIKTSPTRQGE